MSCLIEHIDAIARRKQRDALFVTFYDDPLDERSPHCWDEHPAREAIIAWLNVRGYGWNLWRRSRKRTGEAKLAWVDLHRCAIRAR